MASVQAAAPASEKIIAWRRSQRSTSAPASGSIRSAGSAETSWMRAKSVVEPVFRYTQTPRAKAVSPDPVRDTSCPNQMTTNARNPDIALRPMR